MCGGENLKSFSADNAKLISAIFPKSSTQPKSLIDSAQWSTWSADQQTGFSRQCCPSALLEIETKTGGTSWAADWPFSPFCPTSHPNSFPTCSTPPFRLHSFSLSQMPQSLSPSHPAMLGALPENLPSASFAAALGPAQSVNLRLILPFAPFPLLLLALIIILPGIREHRALSLLTLSIQLCIGALLIGSIILPFWKVSREEVLVQLNSQADQRHLLGLGVNVGLNRMNITLDYVQSFDNKSDQSNSSSFNDFHLNEQFDLAGVSSMAGELLDAFVRGQPFPVLRVLEYFSLGADAFSWGHQFRNAGHFSHASLWASFAFWLLQCVLLPLLPHHFAKAGLPCGIFALLADLLYIWLSPNSLHIPFPSSDGHTTFLHFRYGACFWMSLCAGFLSLLLSSTLCLLQLLHLYSLSTFLNSSLDDTVGPSKCRFGGGRREQREFCAFNESSGSCSSRLDSNSMPSCKFSVTSSVSSFSVSGTSLCSSAGRMPRTHQTESNLKSVELIRRRALARNLPFPLDRENTIGPMHLDNLEENMAEQEEQDGVGMAQPRRKEGIAENGMGREEG